MCSFQDCTDQPHTFISFLTVNYSLKKPTKIWNFESSKSSQMLKNRFYIIEIGPLQIIKLQEQILLISLLILVIFETNYSANFCPIF